MRHVAIYDQASGRVVATRSAEDVGEPEEGFSFVDYDPVTDPRGWEVEKGTLVPVAPITPTFPVTYTFNQWVDRFPLSAQAAIVQATTADPIAKLIYDRAFNAGISGSIDPADPRTIEGVQYLASKGYITTEEAAGALAL